MSLINIDDYNIFVKTCNVTQNFCTDELFGDINFSWVEMQVSIFIIFNALRPSDAYMRQ